MKFYSFVCKSTFMYITPDFLKPNDKIGIVSPAGKIDQNKIDNAVQILESWGLEVILGKHICSEHAQFAGTDEQRAEDFQLMLDNKNIKAIICARGGYGTIRIIDKLDFSNFIKNPKWIVGYSDITVLHAYINNLLQIKTIHALMPISFPKTGKADKSLNSLNKVLFGSLPQYEILKNKMNRSGSVKGILIGGNLSIIQSISGVKFDYDTKGKILFIEDVNEYLYKIDRILKSLEMNKKLNNIAGLIIGQFTKMKDNKIPFGMNAYEIIYEKVKKYKYPVVFGFNAGHSKPNLSLVLGSQVGLEVNQEYVKLRFY